MVQEHVLNSDSHEPSSFIIKELLISQTTVNILRDFSHRPYQIPNTSKKLYRSLVRGLTNFNNIVHDYCQLSSSIIYCNLIKTSTEL